MDSSVFCTGIIFGLITFLVVFTFHQALRGSGTFSVMAVIWIAMLSAAALAGYYKDTDTIFPRLLLVVVPPAILLAWLFLARPGKVSMDGMDIHLLTMIHVVRAPIELVLYWSFIDGMVPHEMTFGGGNLDILSGLSAPCIYYWGIMKNGVRWPVLVIWNFACLGLLINAIFRSVLSTPVSFQTIGFEQPNILAFQFPFTLLPGVVVPIILCAHLVVIRNLVRTHWQDTRALHFGRAVINHFFS